MKNSQRMDVIFCQYNPEIHRKHCTDWTNHDVKYLIDNYRKIPLTELSLALERTYKTVAHMVYRLKKKGKIPW